MSLYKANADYAETGTVLKNPETERDEFEARMQIATKSAFMDVRTTREGFDSMLNVVEAAVEETEPKPECQLENGSFWVDKAPLGADDEYKTVFRKSGLQSEVTVSTEELSGLYDLMRTVHSDYEVKDDNEDLEVHS